MKNVRKLVVAVVLIAATGFVNALSKVAHINVQELLAAMPEMKSARAELKKVQETYRSLKRPKSLLRKWRLPKVTITLLMLRKEVDLLWPKEKIYCRK